MIFVNNTGLHLQQARKVAGASKAWLGGDVGHLCHVGAKYPVYIVNAVQNTRAKGVPDGGNRHYVGPLPQDGEAKAAIVVAVLDVVRRGGSSADALELVGAVCHGWCACVERRVGAFYTPLVSTYQRRRAGCGARR